MADFSYTAINAKGQQINGVMAASTRDEAVKSIRDQGGRPLSVKEVKGKGFKTSFGGKKVKLKDLVIFTRELATMINAGVPLPRSLNTLQGQIENKYFKEVIGS